jgi:signal transduction histidine kinase
VRNRRLRRWAPIIVVLLVAILAGLSTGTGFLVAGHFRSEALNTSRLYSGVFAGLNSQEEGAELEALLDLLEQVKRLGIPLVVTDGLGLVTAAENLPFDAPLDDPRVKEYAETLDRQNPPIVGRLGSTVHYGPVPAKRQLTALVILQGLTLLGMVSIGFYAYRHAMASQRDRLWVAMAREAAHQMGTPLMSLQGWIEQVRSRPTPPEGLADHLSADAERLERVAQRFERIGNPTRNEPLGLGALADRVAGYFRPRLPRHANPITIHVKARGPGPTIMADPVLLEWALESLVKNAIDALHGQSGDITLDVDTADESGLLRIIDTGPGVSGELHRNIFEPGISTKTGGWGIGLALASRVVEDAHGGSLTLESSEEGACFLIKLPLADS